MKKTLNINLAGYPFTIDEDAYKLLKDYLDTIRYAFDTSDDTAELATDIESRIAELLLDTEEGSVRIVSFEEISKVIERIGKPSDFIEVEDNIRSDGNSSEEEIKIQGGITPPPYSSEKNYRVPINKKLFRDPQTAMLGGVCSGLAAYMDTNVIVVRLITILLFFLSATVVALAYIVLWIVLPEARTPLQRMQMMGESPTMENIGKTVTENFQDENGESKQDYTQNKSGFNKFLSNAFSIFAKCIVILGFIIGFPILLALLIILLACIIAFFAAGGALIGGGIFGDTFNFSDPGGGVLAFYLLMATLGAIITLGVPFWLLARMATKRKEIISTNYRRSLLIIWLIGIALTAVFTVKSVKKAKQLEHFEWNGVNIEQLQELNKLEEEKNIENIDISSGTVILTTKEGSRYTVSKGKVQVEKPEELKTDSIN